MKVKEARERFGISQSCLAHLVGVSRQHINAIEHEKCRLTVEMAKKIAQVINVDWASLYD